MFVACIQTDPMTPEGSNIGSTENSLHHLNYDPRRGLNNLARRFNISDIANTKYFE